MTLQKQTEELADQLRKHGFKARNFHAGMKPEEKIDCQDAFMASSDQIVVATIAFGMGIDKADIRNIIHYDIPRSLEGYRSVSSQFETALSRKDQLLTLHSPCSARKLDVLAVTDGQALV